MGAPDRAPTRETVQMNGPGGLRGLVALALALAIPPCASGATNLCGGTALGPLDAARPAAPPPRRRAHRRRPRPPALGPHLPHPHRHHADHPPHHDRPRRHHHDHPPHHHAHPPHHHAHPHHHDVHLARHHAHPARD